MGGRTFVRVSLLLCAAAMPAALAGPRADAPAPARSSFAPVPSPALKAANLLAARGAYAEAVKAYEAVVKAEPGNAQAFHMFGRTYALMGDMASAVSMYRKAVSLSPGNAELVNDLGVALSANGQYDESIVELKKVIAMSPKFVAAYNNLGVTLMQKGAYADAAEVFRQSLKLQPRNPLIQKKLDECIKYGATSH